MIPISKVPRQSVSSSMMERKKRDREKERSRLVSKRNIPSDAKSRFGRKFQTKLCELLLSDDPSSSEQIQAMHAEALAYYEEHSLTEMWLSDDENDGKQLKAPVSVKMHHDAKGEQRPSSLMRVKATSSTSSSMADEREKMKNKIASPLTPTPPSISSIIPQIDMSEESEDDTSRKTGTPHMKTFKLCEVCSDGSSMATNTLLECEDCGKAIHQKCNRPEVTPAQARDPRFLFVCCNCKERDTRAERSGSMSSSKPTMSSFAKKDDKVITQKPASDLSTAWATFAAKKKKPTVNSNNGASSAFGATSRVVGSIGNQAPRNFPYFGAKDKK